jgi:hypothetical protein
MLSDLRTALADATPIDDSQRFFEQLADEVIDTALKTEFEEEEDDDTVEETPSFPVQRDPEAERRRLAPFRDRLGPGRFAAFVSHLYLDCALVIVGRDD